MINNIEFADRLRKIMDYYQLSASAFADRIQVQRSSISHLLSGRNKPSLEFVMRVVKEFEEVELYWLLNGKGAFPAQKNQPINPDNTSLTESRVTQSFGSDPKDIERIVIFYKDGSFKDYQP